MSYPWQNASYPPDQLLQQLRILQITASYKPAYVYGGPIVSVSELCEKLIAREIDVEVFTTNANGSRNLDVSSGVKQYVSGVPVIYFNRITGDPTHFSPSLLWALWRRSAECNVVHIHAWWNTVSVLATLIALCRKKKVILSPRGTLSRYTFNSRSAFSKRLIHLFIGKWLLKKVCFMLPV